MSSAVKRVRETCDATKVTYYVYSCDTCCMSREMRKWMVKIVPSVKNPKLENMNGIMRIVNEIIRQNVE